MLSMQKLKTSKKRTIPATTTSTTKRSGKKRSDENKRAPLNPLSTLWRSVLTEAQQVETKAGRKTKRVPQASGRGVSTIATAYVNCASELDEIETEKWIQRHAPPWQRERLSAHREVLHFVSPRGPMWRLQRRSTVKEDGDFPAVDLPESDYAWYREQVGSIWGFARSYGVDVLQVDTSNLMRDQALGALVGLELAAYHYRQTIDAKVATERVPRVELNEPRLELIEEAKSRAFATNLARQLVNLPPNLLRPPEFVEAAKNFLKGKKNLEFRIWEEEELRKQGMGLHLAVGRGAEHGPRTLRIRYRPPVEKASQQPSAKTSQSVAPIVFVGKGITFDAGGLDIKPSSNMRLMKKDMGGAASLVGLAAWLSDSKYTKPVDLYMVLAENSVDQKSFRPSDVLVARNGLQIEIHNTDAEGRLVLADWLDYVTDEKSEEPMPSVVIDVATLTGAIKAGLGSQIAGLFANHHGLAEELEQAGVQTGDLNWRMPLYSPYASNFSSPFGDLVNATDGFGGAITAALFLQKFVRKTPWAHLDIYAWTDKATGSLSFAGANGQPVQSLISFLLGRTD